MDQAQRERALQLREARLDRLREQDRQAYIAAMAPGRHREEGVPLWAWCKNVAAGCSDKQERVLGVRITTNTTYRDAGGDESGPIAGLIMNSDVTFDFDGDDERYCQGCGQHRQLGNQERVPYAPVSGFAQDGLLKIMQGWVRDGYQPPTVPGSVFKGVQPPDRVTELEKELAELRALVKPQDATNPVPEGNPAVEVPKAGNGHGPQPDATQADPPTRDASWATIESNIHRRVRADGSATYRVKARGALQSGFATLEEARAFRDEILGAS